MLEVIDTSLDRATHLADGGVTDGIPAGLDDHPPGPILAAWLSAINVERLSGYDRIVVLRAHQRLATHYTAHTYRDMAAVTDILRDESGDHLGETELAAEAEIRTALTWTRRLTESELSLALDLRERLPRVLRLLESGAIDVRKAKAIVDGTMHLSEIAVQAVVDQIVDEAPGLTTGQLRARVRKLCITADPDDAKNRCERAIESRRVVMQPTVDGTAHLFAFDLPPDGVAAQRSASTDSHRQQRRTTIHARPTRYVRTCTSTCSAEETSSPPLPNPPLHQDSGARGEPWTSASTSRRCRV